MDKPIKKASKIIKTVAILLLFVIPVIHILFYYFYVKKQSGKSKK
jgi:hypothetical protein